MLNSLMCCSFLLIGVQCHVNNRTTNFATGHFTTENAQTEIISSTDSTLIDCSEYTGDELTCRSISQCIYQIRDDVCNISTCSQYNDRSLCMTDYNCIWINDLDEICISIDESCLGLEKNICDDLFLTLNICFWYRSKGECLPISRNCKYNMMAACLNAKGCIWNGQTCNLVSSYGEECSSSIDDIGYTGTQNITCDGTPCLSWYYIYRHFSVDPVLFQYDTLVTANNYCRSFPDNYFEDYYMGSWCYVYTQPNNTENITIRPCCVPKCDTKHDEKSKCKFTNRGRYEYVGKQNVSCMQNKCEQFPQSYIYTSKPSKDDISVLSTEWIISDDFPVDNLGNDLLKKCRKDPRVVSPEHDGLCFDVKLCRNPVLHYEGDFCYVKNMIHEGQSSTYNNFVLTRQSCCTAVCEDGDQVKCTWSTSGREYSGRIDMTVSGQKCVNWSRSFHKSDAFGFQYKGRWIYKHDLLSMFPDHSLDEAANYCRNPTRDPCGPWCYTSYADNSREYCNIPECSNSNKAGQYNAVEGCVGKVVMNTKFYMTYVIQPLIGFTGILLNIFSINVFGQESLKHCTTSLMFRVLAIIDTVSLILGPCQDFFVTISGYSGIENIHDIVCKLYWPVRYFCWSYPGYVLVFITIERSVCIYRPLDVAIVCSKYRISKWLIISGIIILSIYCPNLVFKTKWTGADKIQNKNPLNHENKYQITYGNCVSLPTDFWTTTIMTFMVYADFVVAVTVPFSIMFICNSLLIVKLIESQKSRANLTNTAPAQNLTNLTRTLLVVSFTYIILTSPSAILVLGWDYFGITSEHSSDSVRLGRSMASMLLSVNNAFNFVQYAWTGKRFRTSSKGLIIHIVNVIKRKLQF